MGTFGVTSTCGVLRACVVEPPVVWEFDDVLELPPLPPPLVAAEPASVACPVAAAWLVVCGLGLALGEVTLVSWSQELSVARPIRSKM